MTIVAWHKSQLSSPSCFPHLSLLLISDYGRMMSRIQILCNHKPKAIRCSFKMFKLGHLKSLILYYNDIVWALRTKVIYFVTIIPTRHPYSTWMIPGIIEVRNKLPEFLYTATKFFLVVIII